MNLYVSWSYYSTAASRFDESALAGSPIPAGLFSELEELRSSTPEQEMTPLQLFERELLGVQIMSPWSRQLFACTAARRFTANPPLPAVSQVAHAVFRQLLGADYGVPKIAKSSQNPQVRIIGLSGLREFLKKLAVHRAATGDALPFEFWQDNPCVLELPLSFEQSREVLRGCALYDDGTSSAYYNDLLDRWRGIGFDSAVDLQVLMTLAVCLKLQDPVELSYVNRRNDG